ncbi:hypothetical protein G4B88_003225 [Cannabis sativa]|uniref:Uncharacterized protein n=1 Tax=Cannabis sativa TaxID=3483 RepID=A0A7J6I3Y9_CANSA|nr:hypothetical protein G4B88_003225 [Cannabis sativa]
MQLFTSNTFRYCRKCYTGSLVQAIRQYRGGWGVSELAEEAESRFCIVPLAKGFLKMASNSINHAANSAVKALERPKLFSPQLLQPNLNDKLHKIKSLTNSGTNSFLPP